MELKHLLRNARANEELIIPLSQCERFDIIEELRKTRGWYEDVCVESKTDTWYLFANYLNDFTISIHTGKDDLFDDVIINGR